MKKFKKGKAAAEQKLAERQAAKEETWRKVVMDAPNEAMDVKFHGKDGWVKGQEEAEPSKPKGALQQKAEASAKASLLGKVHGSITKKIMTTLLDISTQVLESTEPPLRVADKPLESGACTGAVVNCLNGIILSFLFELSKKNKMFPYLRRFASDQLSKNLASIFDESTDAAKAASELTAQLSGLIKEKEAMAAEMVTVAIQKMMDADVEVVAPDVEGVPVDAAATKEKIDAMMKTVGDMALKFAVSKMDTTITVLVGCIGALIDQVARIYEEVKSDGGVDGDGNINTESLETLQERVAEAVATEYAGAFLMVSDNVGGLVSVLDKMMAPGEDGGDDA